MERSRRELYAAPTNPAFLAAWRDYEAKYNGPICQMRYVVSLMAADEFGYGPASDEKTYEASWKAYAADWREAEQSSETLGPVIPFQLLCGTLLE